MLLITSSKVVFADKSWNLLLIWDEHWTSFSFGSFLGLDTNIQEWYIRSKIGELIMTEM